MISYAISAYGSFSSQTLISSGRFLRNGRSFSTCPPQSTVFLPLREFGLLNQINSPSAPSLINDRNLLWVFGPLPPLFSSRVLDLASRFHLHIDDSHHFGFPEFRNIKSQIFVFPNGFYLELIIH
jgi:hypothetical protein